MSRPEDLPDGREIDHLTGEWMDGDAESVPSASEPASENLATAGRLSDKQRRAAVDLQLLHAILLHLNHREPADRQARIDRAVDAIRQLQSNTAGRATETAARRWLDRRRLAPLVRWAVAASLLAAALVWLSVPSSNAALAALDQVVEALDSQADRTYRISVRPADTPAPRPPGGSSPRPRERAAEQRAGLDGATLYARGGDQFVLVRLSPDGRPVINGFNGREHWFIRPDNPVEVSSDPGAFRIPMPENLAAIPFADIRATLTSLREEFRVKELPAERLDGKGGTLWRHLQAGKRGDSKGPRQVSIWFHPTTNLIGRIDFMQIRFQGRPEPRDVTISLVDQQPLPANWFDHDAHHSPATPVSPVWR